MGEEGGSMVTAEANGSDAVLQSSSWFCVVTLSQVFK